MRAIPPLLHPHTKAATCGPALKQLRSCGARPKQLHPSSQHAYCKLVTKVLITKTTHWNAHLSTTCKTAHTAHGAGALRTPHRREVTMIYHPTLLPKGTGLGICLVRYCHSWELRLLGSPLGCRVLLLIMSAKHTWTDQEPQLCHFEIITLDLCLQSSWARVDSCPSEDKQSRCTTVSIYRPLSSKIRQATNLFLPALAYKRGFLHIRKLWFLVFISLICALTYSSLVFRNDCNFNMLASFEVVK